MRERYKGWLPERLPEISAGSYGQGSLVSVRIAGAGRSDRLLRCDRVPPNLGDVGAL